MELFGTLKSGEKAYLYTISGGRLKAVISDLGATVVRLYVDAQDVVLGFDDPNDYIASGTFFGAVVGRNCNRTAGACVRINDVEFPMDRNDNGINNLHSGLDFYKNRIWSVVDFTENRIKLMLHSPDCDQGFPGNAVIRVTYALEEQGTLRISYDAVADRDTVFNMTNHSYFNLAGHCRPEKAMEQVLSMPARFFTPATAQSIPTGELRAVEGTPMDFRTPKALGRDIGEDYEPLHLQKGYDHNFEVLCNPCAQLSHPESGRSMAVYTDCPGVQVYTANYTTGDGKDGVRYEPRCAVCLETQFYPDAIHNPQWKQPVTKAGEKYKSQTTYRFSW